MQPSRKDCAVCVLLLFKLGRRLLSRLVCLPIRRLAAYASEQLEDRALGSAPVGQRKKVVLVHEKTQSFERRNVQLLIARAREVHRLNFCLHPSDQFRLRPTCYAVFGLEIIANQALNFGWLLRKGRLRFAQTLAFDWLYAHIG